MPPVSFLPLLRPPPAAAAAAAAAAVPATGRACRITCSVCSGVCQGKQASRQDTAGLCSQCQQHPGYRKQIYTCLSCVCFQCSHCARAAQQTSLVREVESPSGVMQPGPPSATLTSIEEADRKDLLPALRLLPSAYVAAPLLWVPRSVRSQVGAVLRQLLDEASRLASAENGNEEAETAHLLLRNAPQLLLHWQSNQPQQPEDMASAGCIAAAIEKRLSLARNGQWDDLIKDYLAAPAPPRSPGAQASAGADEPLSQARAQAAALRARTGSLRGAASLLTGGAPVPPGPETDDAIKGLFHVSARNAQQQDDLRDVLADIDAIPQKKRLRINLRMAGRQVASLKPAAGPGASGWRNSYIQCLYADAAGPTSIMAWAQIWASGEISPWLAYLWTGALARPFWKDAQRTKIRPVLCGEVLLKLAMGIISRGAEKQLGVGFGPRQFGAGRAAGAASEVAEVRAAAAAFPDNVILSLDVKNAFGEVAWPVALRAALRRAPLIAVPMAAMWRCGHALVYTMMPCGTVFGAALVFMGA